MKSISRVVLALLTVVLTAGSGAFRADAGGPAPSFWVIQHTPTVARLADVSCPSISECFAVGTNGTIIKTVNGGTTWSLVRSGYAASHPGTSFVSVRCPVSGVCSVLAPPNTVLRTTDGGRSWQAHQVTLPPLSSGLGRLACPTRNVCYVTASPGYTSTWFTHSAAVLKSSDGGRNWRSQPIPSRVPCPGDCRVATVGYDLQWISCQNSQSCRAGGDTFIGSHEGFASAVIRTDNGGAAWKLVHSSFDPNVGTCPTTSICTGVFYQPLSPNTDRNLMRSTDGGTTWNSKPITPILTAIACSGPTSCQLAGPGGRLASANGLSLIVQASPTTKDLDGVACPRASYCYAVGAGGIVLARKG